MKVFLRNNLTNLTEGVIIKITSTTKCGIVSRKGVEGKQEGECCLREPADGVSR